MNETELRNQANQYIQQIIIGVSFFERSGKLTTPTVFMSIDVFDVLQAGTERALYVNQEFQTVCGCKVELVSGTGKLYIGFNLLS